MSTKTKIALAAVLVAATSSVALATEFDPNPANRYPAYAEPIYPQATFRSAPVQLHQGRNVATQPAGLTAPRGRPSLFDIDRASSPHAGGVG